MEETIYIPVFDSEDVIAVPIGPSHAADPEEVLECLKAEEAPLGLWLDIVKAYLAAGHTVHAEKMLREGTSAEVEQHFSVQEREEDRAVPQRVQLLCTAAAFETTRGRLERDRGARNEIFARAGGLLTQARALDFNDQMPSLGNAQLSLAKGDVEGAKREYEKALKQSAGGQRNIAPLLGLATLAFNQGNHAAALGMFRKALRTHPNAPAEVRLGIGAAAFKLGRHDTARSAFQRALHLQPRCVPALAGLAVLAMHAPPSANRLAEALQLLCQAYDLAPGSAVVLNLLAHHCLLRGDYDKVTALATAALQAADSERLRADAEALLARAAHAQNDLRTAFAHYRQALAVDGRLPVAQYGLAQMTLLQGQGEIPNAISLLESSLTAAPAWADALTVLAGLYPAAPGKRSAAVSQFQEAAHKATASGDVWFMLAELLAPTDPAGALKAYDKAIELHRRAAPARPLSNGFGWADGAAEEAPPPAVPPVRLLNNAAVLHLRYGNLTAALPLMEEAVEGAAEGPTAARLTVGFNMARMREAAGDAQAAAREYKGMLENFPEYIDCQLRLAAIAARGGKRGEAQSHLRAILKQKPGNADALAFMGQLHFEAKEYSEASEAWEQLGAARDARDDAYARLGLANLVLVSAPADSNKEDVRAKRRSRLAQALKMYRDILAKHPGNVYAVNGIGAVLAEQGRLAEAREIFTEVQEAVAAEGRLRVPEVWANAGGAALGVHDTGAAIQQFTTALRRFHHNHESKLLWWKARAFYDADDLDAARRWLQKALHLAPAQPMLRFNIAAVMQQSAVRALRKERGPGDVGKLEDYEAAAEALNTAANSFVHLRRLPPARSRLDGKKLDAHIEFCQTTLRKATAYVETAQREQAIADAKRKEQELRMKAAEATRNAEAKRKAAMEAAAKQEREARATAAVAKLERLKAGWKENQALQAAAAAGDSGAVGKKKRQDKADEEMDALFGESSGDEDYDPNAPDPLADAAGAAAGGAEEAEEPEYASDGDAEREALAEGGLLTGDEDAGTDGGGSGVEGHRKQKGADKKRKKKPKPKGDGASGSDAGPRKATKSKSAPSPGGRLKRLRDAGAEGGGDAAVAAGLEDVQDAAPADSEAAGGGRDGDADAAGAAPRPRKAAVLEDSDDEAPGEQQAAPGAADDVPMADASQDEPAPDWGDAAPDANMDDDLFGSDEET